MGRQISDNKPVDYIHTQVAIRELLAWLIGAMIGCYIGVCIGLLAGSNLAPIIGGVIGWCSCSYIGLRMTRALFRSKPKFTISARSVRDACFGLIIGALVGDFISVITETSRLVGLIAGLMAGLLIGGIIGQSSTRNALEKETKRKPGV
jgi:uncharacterized membrane protein